MSLQNLKYSYNGECFKFLHTVKKHCGECPYCACLLTFFFVCLFVIPQHSGRMNHVENQVMPEGYHSINEAYSQSQVNIQAQFIECM